MSFLTDGVVESIGNAMIDTGEYFLNGATGIWNACTDTTMTYLKMNPQSLSGGWSTATGSIFSLSMAIAGALAVMFFLMGWIKESTDLRNMPPFESMFKVFIRLILTMSLLTNAMALVTGITECSTAIVSGITVNVDKQSDSNIFEDFKDQLADDEASGGTILASGFVALFAGFFGAGVVIVCGFQIVLTVFSRLFKMYLCIPFAPAAFSGFAGGQMFASTGIAWIKTFTGYALEAVVIALAIAISYGVMKDAAVFNTTGEASAIGMMLTVCGYCMPMLACSTSAKLADNTVRRCLGLG